MFKNNFLLTYLNKLEADLHVLVAFINKVDLIFLVAFSKYGNVSM